MRLVIQRVSKAQVSVDGNLINAIDQGFLILVGIENADNESDVVWLADKVAGLRIFSDDNGKMNLSIKDISGSILAISQFTLHAQTAKGNRPSFIRAAAPDFASQLYTSFCQLLISKHHIPTYLGVFGADMKVELLNDGPVTIIIDSKQRE
jgi:D-tyrosyl-tRNA(Tyr) deacylase